MTTKDAASLSMGEPRPYSELGIEVSDLDATRNGDVEKLHDAFVEAYERTLAGGESWPMAPAVASMMRTELADRPVTVLVFSALLEELSEDDADRIVRELFGAVRGRLSG